jgi:phage terminase large subunit
MVINDAYLPLFWSFTGDDEGNTPPAKRYNVLKGGAGAGKSRAIAQFIYFLLTSRTDFKVLAMHKYENKIRETVFEELQTVIKDEGALAGFEVISSPFKITCLATGSRVIFRGLDDPDKLKSISGVGLIWMEEADMFDLEDWEQADIRMRGVTNYPYQMLISFNPTSELSWLKSTFFDEETVKPGIKEELLLLETTYRDNHYLDEGYKRVLFAKSPEYRRVYLDGEWGRVSADGLFYKRFDTSLNVREDLAYDPDRAVWLSYDFNVNPHVTCLVAQLQDNDELWLIDEIALPGPRNNTEFTTKEFLRRYPDHQAGVYITGDPAGKHQDTRSEKGHNDFKIIEKALGDIGKRMRVAEKAPPVMRRGDFINDIFDGVLVELTIYVARRCNVLLKDLNYQKEGPKGKDKSKVRTKEGTYIEKYGHASDAFDYLVCEVWKTQFNAYLAGPKAKVTYMLGKNRPSGKY